MTRTTSGGGGPRRTGRGRAGGGVSPPPRSGRRPDRPGRRHDVAGIGGEQVEGRQAVRELLLAGRRPVREVWIADGLDPSAELDDIERLAAGRRTRVVAVPRGRIEAEARTDNPQGVLARAAPLDEADLDGVCAASSRVPFLLVLDGITDPQNVGALLRSAECAGVTAVVMARHRAVHVTPTVAKVAAGAIEYLAFSMVPGIPAALARLGELGVATVGLDAEATDSIYDVDLDVGAPVALVLGSEHRGLAALTRRRCAVLASIPQHGAMASLNVAVAGAVACFELARRRAAC